MCAAFSEKIDVRQRIAVYDEKIYIRVRPDTA